jgi:hypothetical protein
MGTLARRPGRLSAPGLDIVKAAARSALALLVLVGALFACSPPDGPPLGLYRAVVSVEGGDLPFGLELASEDSGVVAYLINGPERVRATNVTLEGNRLAIQMPGYQNRIEATYQDGRFEGTLYILRPRGIVRELRLVAMPGETWRFFPKPDAAPLDFSGRWALTFRDADGEESAAIAELTQKGYEVTGTVLRASGDDRFIAGEARGDTLFLSRFDGGTAYLYLGRLGTDGVLAGDQFTGGGSQESFSGRRNATARLDSQAGQTALKPGVDRLAFSFPDIDVQLQPIPTSASHGVRSCDHGGRQLVPEPRRQRLFLKGPPQPRRPRGSEVIQLMFERHVDFASSAKAARLRGKVRSTIPC